MARTPGGTLSAFTLLSTPDAPTITSISTSIGSASVAFTPPSDDGDGAITSYVVTAVDESSGASTGGTGTSSPITVSPPAGGTFKIRMQALNAYGPGRLTEYDTGNVIYGGAELWAWGENAAGNIGDNTVISRSSPVQIGSLTSWSQVMVGGTHTTALKNDGTLWAWGSNAGGRLGDNTIVNKSSPVQIGALTNWYQVDAGGNFTSSIKTDGTLWAWGGGGDGAVGDNTIINRSSPVQIGSLANWSQISAGNSHIAAIKTDGTMWAWGGNVFGPVGDGTIIRRSSPVQIGALTNWSKVSSGDAHTAAVKTDGTLWTWGRNTPGGRLGDNTILNRSSPVQIGALTSWANVSAGGENTAVIKTDGTLWVCGENGFGTVGDNTIINRSSPVQVGLLTNWNTVSVGSNFASAVKINGTLWLWGRDNDGQLGNNTFTINQSSPVQIGVLTNWSQVSAGSAFAAALYGVV